MEPNLSLRKYVEQNFGRQIPELDAGGEDAAPSVYAYLDEVSAAVEGLKRWRVRRWLVLGHFNFGRFAMFADLDPERWGGPVENALVRSIVSGTEQGRDPEALPGVTEDYEIDDPELETEKVVKRLEKIRRRPPPAVASYRALRGAVRETDGREEDTVGNVPEPRPEALSDLVTDGDRSSDAAALEEGP